jgi:hypothetical protein
LGGEIGGPPNDPNGQCQLVRISTHDFIAFPERRDAR